MSQGPRIYIVTDLEGCSGVYRFAQTRDPESPHFARAVEYMMGDIAACVEGLRAGGASDILIVDGHRGGDNFVPHLMAPGARYLTGRPRPIHAGFDEGFDALVLLGFHAMKGTPDGVLNHTQSSVHETRYWYAGRESGEIAQCAMLAGVADVPVILVTGDTATCREARDFLGDGVITVVVKEGISREAAVLYPFAETRHAIRTGARAAVAALPRCRPYKVEFPLHCRREWIEATPAETRVRSREATIDDLSEIYAF